MRVTIHQPDFMPWFGFFHKVGGADAWIVLDHVENNPRDAAFWGRRVRILVNGQAHWLSVPLARPAERGRVGVPLREMRLNPAEGRALSRSLTTVRMAYAATPHFDEFFPWVERCLAPDERTLMERNMEFIEAVFARLGRPVRILLSSGLAPTRSSTALLVELLKGVGATSYLCGQGAAGYQDDALFAEAGIALEYNRFDHPRYPQRRAAEFVPGLSLIDMLFHVGAERTAAWLTSGGR